MASVVPNPAGISQNLSWESITFPCGTWLFFLQPHIVTSQYDEVPQSLGRIRGTYRHVIGKQRFYSVVRLKKKDRLKTY